MNIKELTTSGYLPQDGDLITITGNYDKRSLWQVLSCEKPKLTIFKITFTNPEKGKFIIQLEPETKHV